MGKARLRAVACSGKPPDEEGVELEVFKCELSLVIDKKITYTISHSLSQTYHLQSLNSDSETPVT